MKKKHLLYITALSVILSVMLVGSALLSQVAAQRAASVSFKPDDYVWGDPPPEPWKVRISLGWWYTWSIRGYSIRLEDTVAPIKTRNYWFVFYAYFDGDDVKDVIGAKLVHDGGLIPGTYDVELTITGDYRYGTFEGTDIVTVVVPEVNPP